MKPHVIRLIELSFLSAIILFTVTYITVYQWQSDGSDLIEASLLSILSGGYLVTILLITAAVGINLVDSRHYPGRSEAVAQGHSGPYTRSYVCSYLYYSGFIVFLLGR